LKVHRTSFLFVTIDSCRYDTFEATDAPNLKAVGPLHRAWAPGYFTYASHCAMFMGFTPGDALVKTPFVNPKFAKIFRMHGGGQNAGNPPFCTLEGNNVIDGLKRQGYLAVGTGAVDWFDDTKTTTRPLIQDFDRFFYAGDVFSLRRQLAFLEKEIREAGPDRPVFAFLNLGETHVPYWHEGADWSNAPADNPCKPFGEGNDAAECRRRQAICLRWVDKELAPFLTAFRDANTILCADHGDAWGEDGVWAHGVHHLKVLEVPLILRLQNPPEAPVKPGVLGRLFGKR
jgi:hypothetical protein